MGRDLQDVDRLNCARVYIVPHQKIQTRIQA
jgi:hypothetical protein